MPPAPERYVVCNAVDGDPSCRVAKFILADRPGLVLDGILLAASSAGARRAFVYVNEDYEVEIDALRRALDALSQRADICDIEIRTIRASLVAAENGALLAAIEDRQPLPDLRYLDAAGPIGSTARAIVASAETFANTALRRREAEAGAAGESAVRKVVTVCGDVSREGTVEITLPISLRTVIEEFEGKTLEDLDVRAVQFGGPTGPFLAGDQLELTISHEALEDAGIPMGTGTIEVFAGEWSGLDMARQAIAYLAEQACGKCAACREGTRQMAELVDQLGPDSGTAEQRADWLELLRELASSAAEGSICAVGRYAGVPVLTGVDLIGGGR